VVLVVGQLSVLLLGIPDRLAIQPVWRTYPVFLFDIQIARVVRDLKRACSQRTFESSLVEGFAACVKFIFAYAWKMLH
jgi:cobalamin biosynthesis protein CobD/CbiB